MCIRDSPETAYLVSNEEFDKQLEELGWSPSDMVTMAGMYIDRGMYNMKKSCLLYTSPQRTRPRPWKQTGIH